MSDRLTETQLYESSESGTFSDGRSYDLECWRSSGCFAAYYRQDEISTTVSIDTWNHYAEAADLTVEEARALASFLLRFAEAKQGA